MRRRLWYAALVLLIAAPLGAQRAQLARKGRQTDTGRPQPSEAIRKLPRRMIPNLPATSPPARPVQAPLPLSEDRSRPLLRGDISPLSAGQGKGNPHALPRRPGALMTAYGAMPVVQVTAVSNRWQIFPAPPYRRYADKRLAAIQTTSRFLDPYNRNTYKGDYPIAGRRLFFAVTAVSESTAEAHRIPVPSVPSSTDAGEFGFFGRGEQSLFQQKFRLGFDLFRGSAGFEPVELEVKVTPEFNINYAAARENGLLAIDVRPGTHRTDTAVGMQELYVEKRLFAGKPFFDFTSVRAGIQRFTSDFRGLIFSDEQPGARLFGNFHNNVFQYNLAYFNLLEKDANSGLNHWQSRRQQVWAANLYWSDFLTKGYTLNFSALYNHDQPSFLVDKNGFLVRPAPVGFPAPHKVRAAYAGISGEGHIKRINVSHAFYQAFGRDDYNPIPARNNAQHISAQLAFVETGYERDWMEWKASIFYTSGDRNLNDGHANGFDGIVPNQQIAGGGFLGNPSLADRGLLNNAFAAGGSNFLNREPIPLTGTGLFLFGPNSVMPAMRAGLFEGQANFINPGILLFNAAFQARVTPKFRGTINTNWAKFNRTEVLEALLFQSHIRHAVGLDTGVGMQYRPLLTDNIVVTGGVGVLVPGAGFKDIYTGRTLFSAFVNVRMVF
jgi:hypothetical protein